MQPPKHLIVTCSVLLIAALLAACAAPAAAPTATPVPPTPIPVPPEAALDPVAVAQAWMNAISGGDVDAALALVTDDVSFRFGGEGGIGPTMMGGHLNWWAGIDTKYHIFDCQTDDAEASCNVDVVDGCIAVMGYPDGLPMQIKFVVEQDGKIGEISAPTVGPEWDDYWKQVSLGTAWMQAYRAEELAKRDWSREYGPTQVKICNDFAIAKETQAPATAKAAHDFVVAVNSGDADAALAVFADDPKFQFWNDRAAGVEDVRSMLDWMVGKEARLQIADCEWVGTGTQCALSVSDGCMEAYGASDSLPGKMNFYSLEDGALRQVVGFLGVAERKAYGDWLEAETAWASANRVDELAQAEGYSQETGAMAVKLCQEYAVAPKLDDATAAKIETLVEEIMASGQVPGAAVGIVKDGELVYAKGFGVTKLGSDQPVTADSIFPMGSVAKTPTAVAIMQLVADGKIDLDAPLTEYLPYFTLADPDLGEVTIRRLLSHTAGMPDPIDWLAEYQDENLRSDDAALDDYVRSLGDQSLTYQPGEDWAYSNTGFDILGDVVATVSGQSFEDYLQANVLTPLGMANSSYLLSDLDPAKLAAPHMYDEDGNAQTLDFYPYTRAHAPSGAFYSSIHDMARFAIANMNQGELDGTRVLPASAYEEMWAPQAASPWAEMFGPQVASYGLGWWVGDFNDHPIIGNYGTEFGFQSHMALFPDDDMAVIALVNLFDPEAGQFYALQIGDAVEAELLGVETEPAIQP